MSGEVSGRESAEDVPLAKGLAKAAAKNIDCLHRWALGRMNPWWELPTKMWTDGSGWLFVEGLSSKGCGSSNPKSRLPLELRKHEEFVVIVYSDPSSEQLGTCVRCSTYQPSSEDAVEGSEHSL